MRDSESDSVTGRRHDNGVLNATKHVQTDRFEQRGQSWYVSTDVPSDFLIQVGDVSFHLHKYFLLSRSRKMKRIIHESRQDDMNKVILDELPGGAEAFELAAKFCYGIAIDLTAAIVSGLRCVAEYLEMTEDMEEGNLIFKTESFLSYVVLSSWKDSFVVLKSCEKLSPWAENLHIVKRCSDSIAWKACTNPNGVRWQYTGKSMKDSSEVPPDWWYEDVSLLRIDHFVHVITTIKVKGMRYELVGASIMHYTAKTLTGMIKEGEETSGNNDLSSSLQEEHQRTIIENVISIIPPQNDGVMSCSFLLRLLRTAIMVKAAPSLVTVLEKRVGTQLEQATLADLLIRCCNKRESTTMYDVELVHRLLQHFLIQEQIEVSMIEKREGMMRVARLVDGFLREVSRDKNLSLTKFHVLAEALPESARSYDDGLYAAIDSYLKAHPALSEHERKRLCRVMNCEKLSMDACAHAAQNERLPLRVVVQIIFSAQIKINNALTNTITKQAICYASHPHYQPTVANKTPLLEVTQQSFQEGWATAKKDISMLKFDLETIKTKYLELQHEMENLQRQYNKVTKLKQQQWWSNGWKKLSIVAKMTSMENTQMGPQSNTKQTKKTPRRWRNSLS